MARRNTVKVGEIPTMQKIGVYAIRNKKNNKYYIGSSVNVYTRMKQQESALIKYGMNKKILSDIFNGKSSFDFLILETFEDGTITDKELRKKEYEYIKEYDSIKNGYNTERPFATGKFSGLLYCKKQNTRQNEKIKENYDRISVTLPKGTKQQIINKGETVNGLINRLVKEYLENN